jgi:cytoskeletal protein CcmA (bactofilin family)
MWKQKSESVTSPAFIPAPEPARTPVPVVAADVDPRALPASAEQASITKGVMVRGEITGTDALYIDGTVEGTIQIPDERVTVGRNGHVVAAVDTAAGPCITAREIVIFGAVTGSVFASDRVDLRAQGTLAGDVSTARVSIEDGAYFRGGIDIRRDEKPAPAPLNDSTPQIQPAEMVEA